ncbi:MAG: alpha/beta hydrolase [Candidatus Hodarchaeota archaeon]
MVKKKFSKPPELDKRYKIDVMHARSLEGNPLGSPVKRDLRIYLPPGYFDNENEKYPVIYFLHGYNGSNGSWTIVSEKESDSTIPYKLLPKDVLELLDLDRLLNYEKIDELINKGDLPPFILVQPDASLHVLPKSGKKLISLSPPNRGSFYLNSPSTGNYRDFIIKDVISHVDSNYRTLANKQKRALMGGSMGGYGTISIAIFHPDKFIAASSLSPGNVSPDPEMLEHKLVIPFLEKILGGKWAARMGKTTWTDILDSVDLVFSGENRLLDSIKRNENGEIVDVNMESFKNWEAKDLKFVIKKHPDALKKVHLQLNCDINDEFGLTKPAKKIHRTLKRLGIEHEFEIYSDPKTVLSPHIVGIGYHILPGIQFCCKYFS